MLSEQEAVAALLKAYPGVKPSKIIVHDGLYLVFAKNDDPAEGDMDPYYSVDMNTGAARDFSIYRDGKAKEIVSQFVRAPAL